MPEFKNVASTSWNLLPLISVGLQISLRSHWRAEILPVLKLELPTAREGSMALEGL